ncbi:MAG: lytic transglycosylase domain-containing protein [Firmicutes bacterium]|nr:lytic transglycosylase domain-containing protein [Bacillota bacterium]
MILKKRKQRLFYLFLFFALLYLLLSQADFISKRIYRIKYRDEIFYYAEANQLDPYLVAAVIQVESNFNPRARSPKGAVGLMQLMPSTARWAAEMMGLDDYSEELLLDPQYNIKIGCWYLNNLLQTFEGNRYAALAAYNGGRGEVMRWLQEGIWDGSLKNYRDIPFPETREFVKKVEDYYNLWVPDAS